MTSNSRSISAYAPATIGNVSVGFDILGLAIKGVGDVVNLEKRKDDNIIIQSLTGVSLSDSIPLDTKKNTAGAALLALQKGENLSFGFNLKIQKGIPLGSGMGGSAASAVAAVVAASRFVKRKISFEKQFFYALEGEKIASGAAHPDNVAPCFKGGLTLSSLDFETPVISIPFVKTLGWVLVHPQIKVETKQARKILARQINTESWVAQSARLAAFISGFYKKDIELLRQGFNDFIIEPQRQHLIPGFVEMKKNISRDKNLIGFSISGSGPSVFALTSSLKTAKQMALKIQSEFSKQNIISEGYFGSGPSPGARIISSTK